MRNIFRASVLLLAAAYGLAADSPLDWAFLVPTPGFQSPLDDGQPKHVTGSTRTYTQKQIDDIFNQPDWYPDEHPTIPALVQHGKPPSVNACAQCHLTSGRGHPESANLAGLPAEYIEEQMMQFRDGSRISLSAARNIMRKYAMALSDDEVKSAAEYFSSIKPAVWTKVVEADTVPKTFIDERAMRFVSPGDASESIGQRIIEVPENAAGAREKDPHAPFIAYVPLGSIKRGETLATTGESGKTIQCIICHGTDFRGLGNVPGLAGRSPIYIFRQLHDIKSGTRRGNAVALMQPVVAALTQDDMIALAAFMASRNP
jgi:cytochrome c553